MKGSAGLPDPFKNEGVGFLHTTISKQYSDVVVNSLPDLAFVPFDLSPLKNTDVMVDIAQCCASRLL
jgi:hypothetical protein